MCFILIFESSVVWTSFDVKFMIEPYWNRNRFRHFHRIKLYNTIYLHSNKIPMENFRSISVDSISLVDTVLFCSAFLDKKQQLSAAIYIK